MNSTYLAQKLAIALVPLLFLALASCDRHQAGDESSADESAPAVTHLDAIAASQLLAKPDSKVIILDVRTPEEFAAGHLPGKVVNADFKAADFSKQVAGLDNKATYLVHCQGGGRSSSALEVLTGLGFEKLYHLDGGLSAWTDAGELLEK